MSRAVPIYKIGIVIYRQLMKPKLAKGLQNVGREFKKPYRLCITDKKKTISYKSERCTG